MKRPSTMPTITKLQRKRLLERIATILHEDASTEGFQEQCEAIDLSPDVGTLWLKKERDALLRRAARLGNGEAQTRIGVGDKAPKKATTREDTRLCSCGHQSHEHDNKGRCRRYVGLRACPCGSFAYVRPSRNSPVYP